MAGGMVSLYRVPALPVKGEGNGIADLYRAVGERAEVEVHPLVLLRVGDVEHGVADLCGAAVADLTSALAVEHGPVADHGEFALVDAFDRHIVGNKPDVLCLAVVCVISDKAGLCEIVDKRL